MNAQKGNDIFGTWGTSNNNSRCSNSVSTAPKDTNKILHFNEKEETAKQVDRNTSLRHQHLDT